MKPNLKDVRVKEIVRARERINEIYKLQREAPYVPTKKKIFVGHWRFFKVRDDILRSSIGDAVKVVVEACNSWRRGDKKDPASFEKGCYSTIYSKYAGCTTVSKQHLNSLNEKQMEALNAPNKETFIRRWFDVEEKTRSYGSKNVVHRRYYPKIPDHMLEFAYKPAFITHEQVRDGDLESELTKLKKFMDDTNGWYIVDHPSDRSEYDYTGSKKRIKEKLLEKEIEEID